jgi:competence protein ComFC
MPFEEKVVFPIASNIYHRFWESLDWIFPPHCAGCEQLGQRWCPDCHAKTKLIKLPVCKKCGEPVSQNNFIHQRCSRDIKSLEFIRSYGFYQPPLLDAIHKLKYQNDIGIAESLSTYLVELYRAIEWETDVVMPVPLNKQKLSARGYNQAKLIARPFSYAINKPLISNALFRKIDTQSQVGLSRNERILNVTDAFIVRDNTVQGKRIILIDDVSTTGATLEACAKSLKEAGAEAIVGLTLAKAVHTNYGFSDQIQFKVSNKF